MPFAKVGAMPMATSSSSSTTNTKKKYSNVRRGSKPRGITMEDLKRQTALRLAQEQNLGNVDPTMMTAGVQAPPPTQQHYSSMHQRGQHYPRNDAGSFGRAGGGGLTYPSSPNYQQVVYATNGRMPQPAPSSFNNIQYQQQMPPPQPPAMVPQHHPGGYAASTYGSGYGSGPTALMSPGGDFDQASLQMGQSRYNSYETNQHVPATSGSKLPHGLTVHELKEMTKARLQAEAAEKEHGDIQPRERGVSPLDFEVSSIGGGRERAWSRDSTGRNSTVSFHQDQTSLADGYIRPVSHSPSHRYNVNRTDTWDSASVASHNSNAYSENYGSETTSEVSGSMAANRARSFTVPAFPSTEEYPERDVFPGPSSMHASTRMPAFDAAVGGNRRRAVTLSPNTGSILEDRPHHGTWTRDRLNLPSVGPSTSGAAQARQRVYSPVLEQLGLEGPPMGTRGNDSVIGSSVYGSSFSDFQSTSASSSEFLRESSSSETRVPAPPPGFRSSDPTALAFADDRQTGFSPDQSVRSIQDTFLQGDKNPWGSDPRRRLASVENLASDLGSILNLSGSDRQERERANTYTFGSDFPLSLPEHGDNFSDNDGFASKGGDPFRY